MVVVILVWVREPEAPSGAGPEARPAVVVGWRDLGGGSWGLMAAASATSLLIALFLAYGTYSGSRSRSNVTGWPALVPAKLRGVRLRLLQRGIRSGALPASLVFGGVWALAGPTAAFLMGAALAGLAAIALLGVPGPVRTVARG